MKPFMFALLICCSIARADDVIFQGKYFRSARITSAKDGMANISSRDGSASVPISTLPPSLRASALKMAADAAAYSNTVKSLQSETELKSRQLEEKIAARAAARLAKLKPALEQGAVQIIGHVMQKTDAGVLIDADNRPEERLDGVETYRQTALLTGHPDETTVVDGDDANVLAIPDGIYTYADVAGAKRTVRRFKWIPNPLLAK